ncbi:MAG: ATP synthase F0 subunit C [Puniceicoccaceae bacterium]
MIELFAQITGDIGAGLTAALGCTTAALGVAMIGTKAVESVGRNPGASTKILVQSIIGMALAEAVAFYSLFLYQG